MTDNPLRHGLVGNSAAVRQRIQEDENVRLTADVRTQQGWTKKMASKVKTTKFGPVQKPPATKRADEGLDTLGGLINDIADSIRDAQRREQVVDSASPVDTDRFPIMRPNGAK